MLCTEHPLYHDYPDLVGELMRSWEFAPRGAVMNWQHSFYHPRYLGHSYNAPADSGSSADITRYHGLDLFVAHNDKKIAPVDDYITIEFQRPVTVFLMLPQKEAAAPQIGGWTYEGTAKLAEPGNKASFGVYRQIEWHFHTHVYVFSKKSVNERVTVPSLGKMASSRHINMGMHINLLIAEHDGKPSTRPENLLGKDEESNVPDIPAGGRCPELLHDVWKIQGHDANDEQTHDMWFRTFHPLWDPCYFCAYDHEHGSDVVRLMGYHPRFGYAALKNYEQDESHKGFKGHVLKLDKHYLYYQLHAHLSRKGRFTTRTHTVVILVTDAETGAIEVELTYKQDYGFASVKRKHKHRGKNPGLLAVSDQDEALKHEMELHHTFGSRQMNFHDPQHPNPEYRFPSTRGTNEHWFCQPICSDVRHVKVDFKNPATGAVSGYDDTIFPLGKRHKGAFIQATSNRRDVSVAKGRKWTMDHKLCKFTLDHIHGIDHHGTFYTDPDAINLYDTTGINHMKQYFKHGFIIHIAGTYNACDTWAGLYITGCKGGFMHDVALAIDPTEN